MDLNALLSTALKAAEAASVAILEVYQSSSIHVDYKDDHSPLTQADQHANHEIVRILKSTGFPIISEESQSIPYEIRSTWKYFWLVDPLDGTKEFINRNGEFTVNIALIEMQAPILGVVSVPVTREVYYGAKDLGAFVKIGDNIKPLLKRSKIDLKQKGLIIVASRSHMNTETQKFIHQLDEPKLVSAGSSLKFMLVASGVADAYPRFAPTMEWDTAASHAILKEVGLAIWHQDSDFELIYNKPDLMNPNFLCI